MGHRRQHGYESLAMVDAVQRVGLDHHFHDEIEEVLHNHHFIASLADGVASPELQSLHEVALSFRLLRQQGYPVPADVFGRFKDKHGRFNQEVGKDVKGLMELYEASQLGVDGEDIIAEAEAYSSQFLRQLEPLLDHHQAIAVRHTLTQPHHKNIARFNALNYLHNYQGANTWVHVLQDLAKLDFDLVQSLYKQELQQVSKWWWDMGLSKELEHVRDQPVKWYTFGIACIEDPSLSQERVELTKPVAMIYAIDDVFDVYGTIEELTFFTEAVDRWDYALVEKLPDYMRLCFRVLDDMINEISHRVETLHGWNPARSLRKPWGIICKAFLVEAKWFHSKTLPKSEEYLANGIRSSGVPVILVHLFFLLGQNINTNTVEEIDRLPEIISSTATILRLWNDVGSAREHGKEGREEAAKAMDEAMRRVSEAWKRLNRENLSPSPFSSSPFSRGSLNLARLVPLLYSFSERRSLPLLEEFINCVIYEPATL
uniref:Terpene synthase 23 n=1 Tax=Aquilaria sinensis TaxID=210372 RepID=A0A8E8AT60_9ROSI|nr:terpene synthase 23 [Aquilaria sinensis]